jgi:hypothetical protein
MSISAKKSNANLKKDNTDSANQPSARDWKEASSARRPASKTI